MKTVCYDILSLHKNNLALKTCPACQAELCHRDVDHSLASDEFCQTAADPVISTHLITCSHCNWWALREKWEDRELYAPSVSDMIMMEEGSIDADKPAQHPSVEQLLRDQTCWKNPDFISSTLAVQLFGSAQMLLPSLPHASGSEIWNKIKSAAPIVLPVLFIILVAIFY